MSKLPNGWKFKKLQDCSLGKPEYGANAASIGYSPELPRYIRITDITDDGRLQGDNIVSVEIDGNQKYTLIDKDFLFARSGATVGKTYRYRDVDGWCMFAGYLIRFRLDETQLLTDYLEQFTQSYIYQNWVKNNLRAGAQPNINAKEYGEMPVPLPPLEEQRKIAAILGTWDKAIGLVAALIAALQDRKKGLMQLLLTGEVRFPEFVESDEMQETSIGNLPQDWKIQTGEEISRKITKGASPKWQGFDYQDHGMLFVTSENVRDGFLDVAEPKFLPIEFHDKLANSQLRLGDILINIVGASIGRACIFDDTEYSIANINQAVALMRVKDKHNPTYILNYLLTPANLRRLLGVQSETARPNLSLTNLKHFKFATPMKADEEDAIAKILETNTESIALLHRYQNRLQEQKKGLMQQLLTGQVRV